MNPSLAMPEEGMTLNELSNFVAEQLKRLNLVLKNIDGLNIVDIKFDLQGGAYIQLNRKGLEFFDGTKKSFTVDIDGQVTMTGALIQAVEGAYPNVQLDGEGNIFQASKSATEYIAINPSLTGSPTQVFKTPLVETLVSIVDTAFSILALSGNVSLNSQSGKLFLSAATNMSLDCASLTINGSSGYTGTFLAGTDTVHVENGIITDVT